MFCLVVHFLFLWHVLISQNESLSFNVIRRQCTLQELNQDKETVPLLACSGVVAEQLKLNNIWGIANQETCAFLVSCHSYVISSRACSRNWTLVVGFKNCEQFARSCCRQNPWKSWIKRSRWIILRTLLCYKKVLVRISWWRNTRTDNNWKWFILPVFCFSLRECRIISRYSSFFSSPTFPRGLRGRLLLIKPPHLSIHLHRLHTWMKSQTVQTKILDIIEPSCSRSSN